MSTYTAEDFAATQERYENSEMEIHDPLVVVAALRIAARVMTPPIIADALDSDDTWSARELDETCIRIRSALTESD